MEPDRHRVGGVSTDFPPHTLRNFFFFSSSSFRSRTLAVRALRSAVRSPMRLASTLLLERRVMSSASAALRRVWAWPRPRRASASSRRSCAVAASDEGAGSVALVIGGFEDVAFVVEVGVGVGVAVAVVAVGEEVAQAAFSASSAATRSARWEPRMVARVVSVTVSCALVCVAWLCACVMRGGGDEQATGWLRMGSPLPRVVRGRRFVFFLTFGGDGSSDRNVTWCSVM